MGHFDVILVLISLMFIAKCAFWIYIPTLNQRNISLIYGQGTNFFDSKNVLLIQRNRFVYIKEYLFESTKLSLIQRHFFLGRISKKLFGYKRYLFLMA